MSGRAGTADLAAGVPQASLEFVGGVRDMKDLADLYDLSDPMRQAIVSLARESRVRGWWVDYKDVLRGGLADFESGASMIRTFEALLVPGLFQDRKSVV